MKSFRFRKTVFVTSILCFFILGLFLRPNVAANYQNNSIQKAEAKPDKKEAKDEATSLFGLDKVLTIHLKLTQEAWDTAQPPERANGRMIMMGGRPSSAQVEPAPAPKSSAVKNTKKKKHGGFGIEFEYVHGDVEIDGQPFKDAGVRFKGNSSYMTSSRGLKRPFKFNFDRYVKDGEFRGMTTLNLSNNAMDASQMREALSYEVFRQAGIACARTAFAKLYLTIPGKYDKQYIGLYTMVEQVDETFLLRNLGNDSGLLLKPERVMGLQYFGADWSAYNDLYDPKSGHKGKQGDRAKQRLIEFTKLVNIADDAEFKSKIASYLDVDEFLRFLAGNAITANLDSFLSMGHNYYLYLNPATNKFMFIPWDLNMAFGGFGMAGGGEQQIDLSINHPHSEQNKLIERLLEMPEVKAAYHEHLQKMLTTAFNPKTLQLQIDAIEKLTAEAIKAEPEPARMMGPGMRGGNPPPNGQGGMGRGMRMPAPPLRDFIARRAESVSLQLQGKTQGYIPQNRMGGGGMMMIGKIGEIHAPQLLRAMDADQDSKVTAAEFAASTKQFFAAADKDKNGKLDNDEIVTELNRIMPPPGMGGNLPMPPPPPPPANNQNQIEIIAPPGRMRDMPGGGMGGFPPGGLFAGVLLKLADADNDGQATASEWEAASRKTFAAWDSDKNGWLSEKEITAGMEKSMPRPPGMPGAIAPVQVTGKGAPQ